MVSSRFSTIGLELRIEKKENKQEIVSKIATPEVSSSIILFSALSETCSEVITKRQNPKRFAEVFKICCEVVLGIVPGSMKLIYITLSIFILYFTGFTV